MPFPIYLQHDTMDCGPTCLKMVTKYYGRSYTLNYLREISSLARDGSSLLGISKAAEKIGFRTIAAKLPLEDEELPSLVQCELPVIVHWNRVHYVVVYKISKKYIWIADPAAGKFKLPKKEFEKRWVEDGNKGIVLLLERTPQFYAEDLEEERTARQAGLWYIIKYLRPYRKLFSQIFLGLILAAGFQLIFPFLTQALVDIGIQNQNISFIYLILIGQLTLFISQAAVQFIQSWILLYMSTRVNIALISDFLSKLMRLPISYFDTKMTGDLIQRITDHERVESFLTQSSLDVILSIFSLIIFSVVLFIYNTTIFLIFIGGAIIYFSWIILFLRMRKKVDYLAFQRIAENNHTLIDIIEGMQEIKLQGSEVKRRWGWMDIQAKLFRVKMKSLVIEQYQDSGAILVNQLKDIFITFFAAKTVIEGQMTLGMMLAIQYIVGQLNVPLQQLIEFIRSAQDAKLSLERLNEIHNREVEDNEQRQSIKFLPEGDIEIKDLDFKYKETSPNVLNNISLLIPRGKVTAIVGASGSGKTTLIKLLLGFYKPNNGSIRLGNSNLHQLDQSFWRSKCGVVMQDGFLFSDSIANNISESDEFVNKSKLLYAVKAANIQEFIESSPTGYDTLVGSKGSGISQGQRQRLLIARAIYKDPDFLFFDEATNALDATNEMIIVNNLEKFYNGRTVVIVAHRLSTVKNADQIVVLENGEIIEVGTHQELTKKRNAYYHLVKNQLELGA